MSVWNQEILSMGGLLARIIAEDDLQSIEKIYKEMKLDAVSELWLEKKASHNLTCFTFQQTTPAHLVGRLISSHFYACTSRPIQMISQKGLLPASLVRLKDSRMSGFLKNTPIVPEYTEKQCQELIKRLVD